MQQFVPFEDDWSVLATLRPEDLVPYRSGLVTAASCSRRGESVVPLRVVPAAPPVGEPGMGEPKQFAPPSHEGVQQL